MWREVVGGERARERETTRKGANSNGLVQTRKNSMLLRALGAQPRRRKPAFVTHDNEASLCDIYQVYDTPCHMSGMFLVYVRHMLSESFGHMSGICQELVS
jgi:hypothetical protein